MNRRRRIRELTLVLYRYQQWIPPTPPSGDKPPQSAIDGGSSSSTPSSPQNANPSGASVSRPSSAYSSAEPIFQAVVRTPQGEYFSVRLHSDASPHIERTSISSNAFPIDPELLSLLLQELGENCNGDIKQIFDLYKQSFWVQIPPGDQGQSMLETVVRILNPSGNNAQDGLKALLGSSQFQKLFQGGSLTQGAAQMVPAREWAGVLLPVGALLQNPEAVKSLLIAQGLPPALIQNVPDRAVAGVLQSLLQTSQKAAQNPLQFFQSISSVLTLAGVPVQQVQDLLLSMLQASQQHGVNKPAMTPEGLQQLANRLLSINHPQLLGLNQMVQGQFGQGLAQIFNSFIKVFFGGALLQGQAMWPQVVPNERMLAELGGLFSKNLQQKDEGRGRRRKTKRGRAKIQKADLEFPRVNRKQDLTDEDPPWQDLSSIFIDTEE